MEKREQGAQAGDATTHEAVAATGVEYTPELRLAKLEAEQIHILV